MGGCTSKENVNADDAMPEVKATPVVAQAEPVKAVEESVVKAAEPVKVEEPVKAAEEPVKVVEEPAVVAVEPTGSTIAMESKTPSFQAVLEKKKPGMMGGYQSRFCVLDSNSLFCYYTSEAEKKAGKAPNGNFSICDVNNVGSILDGSKLMLGIGERVYEFECGNEKLAKQWSDVILQHLTVSGGLPHKLYYWGIPGRAEATRLAFHVAGVPLEDITVSKEDYGEMKERLSPTVPLLNLPLLEFGGQHFAESKAILLYIAKVGGLMPADDLLKMKVYEAVSLCDGAWGAIQETFSIADADKKLAARKALFAKPDGKMYTFFSKLEKHVDAFKGGYVCGDTLTVGDIALFSTFSTISSGFLDGVPTDCLTAFPAIASYHNKVASHPSVASRYAGVTEGLLMSCKAK